VKQLARQLGPIDTNRVYVVDNGSYTLKHGFASAPSATITGNFVAKSKSEKKNFRGDISLSQDKAGLFFQRPFDRV
jgi:actin-related protein